MIAYDGGGSKRKEGQELMESPSDLATEQEGEQAHRRGIPPAPNRACFVCKQQAWRWNAEKQMYECGGDQVLHEEYAVWHQQTFPWLHPAS